MNIIVHWKFWRKYGSVSHLFSCIGAETKFENDNKIYLPCCPVVLEADPKTDEVVDEPNKEAVFCCCCPPEAPPNIEGFSPWACWPKTKLNEYDFASSLLFFFLFTAK